MNDFWREMSSDIESDITFQNDFAALIKWNICKAIEVPVMETLDKSAVRKLLESASIFSDSSDIRHKSIAQRICAYLVDLPEFPGLQEVIEIIQGKLHNFPQIRINNPHLEAPREAPVFLKFDFVSQREKQTIFPSGLKTSAVLTDFQLKVWNDLKRGASLSISAPTSAGKSYVLLIYIMNVLITRPTLRILYLVPTRALINQVSEDIKKQLASHSVGDVVVSNAPVDVQNEDASKIVFVLTQERLDVFLNKRENTAFDLVIIDESQMIGAGSRGVLLENAIDRLDIAANNTQAIFAGPLLENPDYLPALFALPDVVSEKNERSATIQNVIAVDYDATAAASLKLEFIEADEKRYITSFNIPFRLQTETDKTSYVAAKFGRNGSSIVYSNGKADAEKIALKICQVIDEKSGNALADLVKFVRGHIHPQYALVDTLPFGIGFHYGHMPALLRKELEEAFKSKKIRILVSTSTLLYGLSLPARNIFLNKPTTGRNSKISSSDFWNLAGRAGRLGQEIQGNVFLINYSAWENPVIDGRRSIEVRSAVRSVFHEQGSQFVLFMDDRDVPSGRQVQMEIVAGKLVSDARLGRLEKTLSRYKTRANADLVTQISERILRAAADLKFSTRSLQQSISISPFRQEDLYRYFIKRIPEKGYADMLPLDPMSDFAEVNKRLAIVFKRIHTYILRKSGKDKSHFFYAPLAALWMRGTSLPVLIDRTIKYNKSNGINKSIGAVIREVMETIESDLRFRYVNLMTCYNNVLRDALLELGDPQALSGIIDIPLYLELGASSGVMINLMALGLSRISAQTLGDYLIQKDQLFRDSRSWLLSRQYQKFDISQAVIREADTVVDTLLGIAG